MSNPELAIIIPVYRGIEQLRACLSALHESRHQDFTVVVVDHGETDNISLFVAENYPKVTLLRGSPDLWWSGATNLGIRYALDNNSQFIMLLNHDCFVRRETIANLVKSIRISSQAIVAPVQKIKGNNRLTVTATSCFLFGFPTIIAPQWWQKMKLNSGLQKTGLIIGGRGVIIPAHIIRYIGSFDQELLPHYGADHDFYHRCRKQGIRLLVDTSTFVDIDDTNTSTGNIVDTPTFRSTLASLRDIKSHRNIGDMKILFGKQLLLPALAAIGLTFYTMRFISISLYMLLLNKITFWNE